VIRIVRWAIPATALGVAGLGLAISSDIEDSWCAPQTGSPAPTSAGPTALAVGGGLVLAASGAVGVGRSLLRRLA
jgi:hypothetical protein